MIFYDRFKSAFFAWLLISFTITSLKFFILSEAKGCGVSWRWKHFIKNIRSLCWRRFIFIFICPVFLHFFQEKLGAIPHQRFFCRWFNFYHRLCQLFKHSLTILLLSQIQFSSVYYSQLNSSSHHHSQPAQCPNPQMNQDL